MSAMYFIPLRVFARLLIKSEKLSEDTKTNKWKF